MQSTRCGWRKLSLVFALAAFCLSASAEAQVVYSGVFRAGSGGSGAWVGQEWAPFLKQWGEFEKQGLRMSDFETYTVGSKRLYAGIFKPGTYAPAAYIGKEWADFLKQWGNFEKQGYRMIDFETWTVGSKRVYGGIFAPGTYGPAAYIGKEWSDFVKQWAAFEKQGYRLFDFETYVHNGKRLWSGIFKPGTYAPAAYIGRPWADFLKQWEAFEKQGYRLLDFESYVSGSQRLYAGVFSPGNDSRGAWFGKEWENFSSQWHNFEKGGLRLTDLEIYEASCGGNCTDQLVMPACPGDPDCAYNYGVTASSTHCEGKPGTCPSPGTGDTVLYRQPLLMNGNQRLIRLSAVDVKDQIFTLPVEQISSMGHNGWRYSTGDWHHAIDYATSPKESFDVVAAAPGKVIHVGWDNWSGNTIVVSHNVGRVTDAYRTIYMHLRNGAANDCDKAWDVTVPWLEAIDSTSDALANYKSYLNATGCTETEANRDLDEDNWGKNSDTIATSLLGKTVTRGQVLAKSGETGPGGGRSPSGAVNNHLHIFFARRDPTDNRWYFFDPYGIYALPSCYPAGMTDSLNISCVRYPVAWKGGKPQYP